MPSAADLKAFLGKLPPGAARGMAGVVSVIPIHQIMRHRKARKRDKIIEFWHAALGGDVATVCRLLRNGIPRNARHPNSGADLILAIARITTHSDQLDESLARILQILHHSGWFFYKSKDRVQDPKPNPLHVLASQPVDFKVQQRCWALMDTEPILANLRNAEGKTVFDIVDASRPDLQQVIKRG